MLYTPTHEWIRVDGEIATIGITDFAQQELGEVVYVELPRLNHALDAGQEVTVLESTKAAVDLYSPLSGTIIEVNEALKAAPETLNHDPENSGWIFKIKLTNREQLKTLLSSDSYKQQIGV